VKSPGAELRVTVSLRSPHALDQGLSFDLRHDEINEILVANGFTEIEHAFQTDCGMTGYSRHDYSVRDADGGWHFAVPALSGILKKRLMRMLTVPDRIDDPRSCEPSKGDEALEEWSG